jgi:hypothetical protein
VIYSSDHHQPIKRTTIGQTAVSTIKKRGSYTFWFGGRNEKGAGHRSLERANRHVFRENCLGGIMASNRR